MFATVKQSAKGTGPLILVGAPSAGMSLLHELIASAENVHVLDQAGRKRLQALLPRRQDSDCLTEADLTPALATELQELARAPMGESGARGNSRLLLTNVATALQIPFWSAVFPDAQFIYLHREASRQIDGMISAWRSGNYVTRPGLAAWDGPRWSLPLIPGWQALSGKDLPNVAAAQWAAITAQLLHDLGQLSDRRWCTLDFDALIENGVEELTWAGRFAGLSWAELPDAHAQLVQLRERRGLSYPDAVEPAVARVREIVEAAARAKSDRHPSALDLGRVAGRNPFARRKAQPLAKSTAKAVAVGRFAASLFAGAAAMPAAAQAATFTVTNLNNDGPGSLRQAIDDANTTDGHDVIKFAVNGKIELFYGYAPYWGWDYQLHIHDDLTIEGPGAGQLALLGSYKRIFEIHDADVTITGLTLQGNPRLYWGYVQAIDAFSDSNLTLQNVTIEGMTHRDGAVELFDSFVQITDSKFSDLRNWWDDGAAIIAAYSHVEIEGSRFFYNGSSNDGGAVFAYQSDLFVSNSRFEWNWSNYGGAITGVDSDITIEGSNFQRNGAYRGGAVLALNSDLFVQGSNFQDNVAYESGGAIDTRDGSVAEIRESKIEANWSDNRGGGIHVYYSDGLIADSVISGNEAWNRGGGISSQGWAMDFVVERSLIEGNRTLSYYSSYGGGLAISGGDTSVVGSSIVGNEARYGGGMRISAVDFDLVNSTVSGNRAIYGGGIQHRVWYAYSADIVHATIVNNHASQGGGIYMPYWAEFDMANSIVGQNGGGDIVGGNANIVSSLVQDGGGNAGSDASNIVGVSPRLKLLSENNGGMKVHVPMDGSPVIDAGDEYYDVGEFDNRGGQRLIGSAPDMGAVEHNPGKAEPMSVESDFPTSQPPFANVYPAAPSLGDTETGCSVGGGNVGGLLPFGLLAATALLRRRKKD